MTSRENQVECVKPSWIVSAVVAFAAAGLCFAGAGGAPTVLEGVLSRFDRFNAGLKTFQAGVTQKKFVRILGEFDDSETGRMYFRRTPKGVQLRKEVGKPAHTILLVNGSDIVVFYPKKNQAVRRKTDESLSGYSGLGIGASSSDLKKNFDISYVNDEKVDGRKCDVIRLTPKNPKLKNYFKVIDLWLDGETAVPVRQRVEEPSGDYTVIQFIGIELNRTLGDKLFDPRLPKGVEMISG